MCESRHTSREIKLGRKRGPVRHGGGFGRLLIRRLDGLKVFRMIETRQNRNLAAFFLGDCGISTKVDGRQIGAYLRLLNSFPDGEAYQGADEGAGGSLFILSAAARKMKPGTTIVSVMT